MEYVTVKKMMTKRSSTTKITRYELICTYGVQKKKKTMMTMMRSWMIMTLSGQREQFGQSCVKTTRKSLSVTLDALHCSLYFSVPLKVLENNQAQCTSLLSLLESVLQTVLCCFHYCDQAQSSSLLPLLSSTIVFTRALGGSMK